MEVNGKSVEETIEHAERFLSRQVKNGVKIGTGSKALTGILRAIVKGSNFPEGVKEPLLEIITEGDKL